MKEDITRVSIELFEQQGFSSTSIQHITQALGVTKGTFYYYFPSKEALLMDIHQHYIDDLLLRQHKIMENIGTFKEQLTKIVEMLIFDIGQQGSYARVYFREMRHLSEDHATIVKEKRSLFRLRIEKMIEQGQTTGEFKAELVPKLMAFAVLGVTNWSYEWFDPDGDMTAELLAAQYMAFILQGIQS
ncbi:TetR family transcriptional regulator [Viridibacillus sp. YIM B01967]|uniref:TetR family transcriptional regulator n=1 Tax=Viridibacillus soli TaxID=2798301 RepID=A0ABS1H5J3_9BACL|nr:TetR/AcrR family transcriptional regulator [Viridibacillus soli]MBK3494655.1 TetR family transcriptional regulator [Viridibacillus soli]